MIDETSGYAGFLALEWARPLQDLVSGCFKKEIQKEASMQRQAHMAQPARPKAGIGANERGLSDPAGWSADVPPGSQHPLTWAERHV